jgi:hypothetical protein
MNKNWLWLVVIELVGFFIYNIVSSIQSRPQYKQHAYKAVYTFDRSEVTSMYNWVVFSYDKRDDLQKSYDYFQSVSLEEKTNNYAQMLAKLSEQSERKVTLLTYESTARLLAKEMEVEEYSTVRGMAYKSEDFWITGFGVNRLQLQENSSLSFIFPADAEILSVVPEPDEREGNVLFWETPGQLVFPVVSYR